LFFPRMILMAILYSLKFLAPLYMGFSKGSPRIFNISRTLVLKERTVLLSALETHMEALTSGS